MIQEYKKIGIISLIAVIMLLALVLFIFVDISFGPIQISSISTILSQYDEVTNSEAELIRKQTEYNVTLANLEKAKTSFNTEKGKYEAISDETIEVIKEATTQEEYSIEYMWIRLGNYAKMNNLEIVLIEPGGGQETDTSGSSNTNTNTNTTTSTPVAKSTTDNTTNSTSNTTAKTTSGAEVASSNNTTTNAVNNENDSGLFSSDRGDTFKIQVSGSYMNVSDFVFAVENDNELRFKLDNISMEYVSGTTIKTTFDVKNMVIKK